MRNFMLRNVRYSLAALSLAIIISGCGSSSKSTNPNPPPGGGGHSAHYHTVSIANLAFSPAASAVAAGDTVVWTNNDNTTHTVTADGGAFNSGNLAPGSNFMQVFGAAGSFPYHCTIHTFMHGSVTVQ